jgi:predicted dehydrogenase
MVEKKLRMGIAGMVNDHVWFMADATQALPNAELVSAAEPYEELRQKAVERWGVKTTYASYEDMLDKEQLDAIIVCSDNAEKAPIVAAAAQRGVHCYVDKPMSAFVSQANEMVASARGAGIKMMIAYHPYFNTVYNTAKSWVQGGRIGQVYLAKASIGHAGPREINLSKYFCEWLESKERGGGGAFVDEAGYVISTFMDYLGPITEVCAFMNQQGWRDYLAADVEDNSVAILKFASGALGMIDSKWGQIGRVPHSQSFHGTEGTILSGWDALRIYTRLGIPKDMQGWIEVPMVRESRGANEAARFVNTVLQGGDFESIISPEGARDVQEVIEAAYISAERGEVVKLPLE